MAYVFIVVDGDEINSQDAFPAGKPTSLLITHNINDPRVVPISPLLIMGVQNQNEFLETARLRV